MEPWQNLRQRCFPKQASCRPKTPNTQRARRRLRRLRPPTLQHPTPAGATGLPTAGRTSSPQQRRTLPWTRVEANANMVAGVQHNSKSSQEACKSSKVGTSEERCEGVELSCDKQREPMGTPSTRRPCWAGSQCCGRLPVALARASHASGELLRSMLNIPSVC